MNSGSWFWPDVSNLDGAEDACRMAKWCALAVSGITAIFAFISISGPRLAGIHPSAFVDAALFGVIAFGLEKQSRVAAVSAFGLFILEKVYTVMQTGSILGVGALGVVILIAFLNGIRGTFAIARLKATSAAGSPTPSAS